MLINIEFKSFILSDLKWNFSKIYSHKQPVKVNFNAYVVLN